MGTWWHDVRYGVRALARTPAFTLLAVLALALGIGANSAMFAVVYGVLLRPLPFAAPERLVTLANTIPDAGVRGFPFSQTEFTEHRSNNPAFAQIAAYLPASVVLTGGDAPERLAAARVSANFFDTLGVTPALGRALAEGADQPGAPCTFVAGHGFWQRHFGGDRAAIGKSLRLDDAPCALIGVLSPDFNFPPAAEIWLPAAFSPQAGGRAGLGRQTYRVVARLRPGVTPEQAELVTGETARRFHAQYPDFYSGSPWKIAIAPLRELIVGDVGAALAVLMSAVGLILLIACANVAHLLLNRFLSKEKELVVRTILGAGRKRLALQVLTECALLGLAGGAVGLWLAGFAVDLFVSLNPGLLPRTETVRVDGAVIGFTFGVSMLVSMLSGLAPALRAAGAQPMDSLRQITGGKRSTARVRDGLVVSEIALALILLVGAGLLARTLGRLGSVDPGVATNNRLTLQISPPASRYAGAERASSLFREITERVATLPGVTSAGGVSALPLSGQDHRAAFRIQGWTPEQEGKATNIHYRFVTPGYFRTLGITLLRGRLLEPSDARSAPLVVLVNQTFAQRFWPEGGGLGHRVSFDRGATWYTIAGVVADVKHYGLAAGAEIEVFLPYEQATAFFAPLMTLVIESSTPAATLVPAIRARIAEIDRDLPIHNIRPMEAVLSASLARPRFQTSLTVVFAGLGLLLAALGTFSILSQAVTQRRYEIGVRLALGAQPREILTLFLRQGMRLTLLGVTLGTAAALGLTRFLSTLLFGVEPTDPFAFAGAIAVLLLAAAGACAIPARRATRVDPLIALRYQ